jgi:hypothetical protein
MRRSYFHLSSHSAICMPAIEVESNRDFCVRDRASETKKRIGFFSPWHKTECSAVCCLSWKIYRCSGLRRAGLHTDIYKFLQSQKFSEMSVTKQIVQHLVVFLEKYTGAVVFGALVFTQIFINCAVSKFVRDVRDLELLDKCDRSQYKTFKFHRINY